MKQIAMRERLRPMPNVKRANIPHEQANFTGQVFYRRKECTSKTSIRGLSSN